MQNARTKKLWLANNIRNHDMLIKYPANSAALHKNISSTQK